MTVELLTYANRAKVAEALTAAGYPVSRVTVNRWARGGEMPGIASRMVLELFGHTPETPNPPAWAEGLATKAAEEAITRIVPPDLLDAARRLIERLEATPQQPPEAPPEGGGSQGRAGAAPR